MENRYDIYSQGSSGWTSMRNQEFQEQDVWGDFPERKDSDSSPMIKLTSFKEQTFISKRLPTATKMIPKSNNKHSKEPKIVQHLAPINVPDWSKIYGTTTSKNSCSWLEEEEEEEGMNVVIPPHEWIARSGQNISSNSVCEGAGRTLKGRDLTRVRNAVLTKTGFLESKSSNNNNQ
ncbi:hypothetical protein BUALT_Bualt03G0115800 [Buddleja alternifolia]|uniref:Breast cancer susceptibility 1 n=1 Tax=Buddleja alternifolia TaxID=168488 RepID=A0AAV6XUJ9_9LAMI|nr:hypothetical protein BUALT_Bualt03G0115800 [Buddleja alternifolia]